jgi:hypothetical protein
MLGSGKKRVRRRIVYIWFCRDAYGILGAVVEY